MRTVENNYAEPTDDAPSSDITSMIHFSEVKLG